MEINGNTKVQELVDALAHDDVSEETNELTHWGIIGMKWGVRRYQNKDGSLTKAGQKRYDNELAAVRKEEKTLKNRRTVKTKMEKLAARKKAVEDEKKQLDEEQKKPKRRDKDAEKEVKKSVKDMGDEELAYKIRRTQMEKQYEALIAEPEPVAKGSGFVKDFMNKSAVPAIQEAGKTLIRDSLLKLGSKYLGLKEEESVKLVDQLKEEYNILNYKDKINKLKNPGTESSGTESARKDKSVTAFGKSKQAAKEKSKQAENEKNVKEKANQAAKENTKPEYPYTVEGVGTNANKGRKWTTDRAVYEVDYTEVVNNSNTSSGRSYASNYLSAPTSSLGLPAPKLGLPAPRDDD